MDELELGGRKFIVVDFERRSVILDHYIMRLIRITGVDKVAPMDGEGNTEYLVRLQTALIDSGRAHELLAGYLLPLGKETGEWTPAMAKDTAAHIAKCNTAEDRELVLQLCMELVFGFFRQGLSWLKRFQDYGAQTKSAVSQGSPTPARV